MLVEEDGQTVRKAAQSADEHRRLAEEASVLRAAAHPGVVELVSAEQPGGSGDATTLVLRKVDGATLAARGRLSPEELAWTGAALATTVADLHDIGIVHRALSADHVIVDDAGRPVLCGFGEARRLGRGEQSERYKQMDLVALARLLIAAAEDLPATRGASALKTAASGGTRRWGAKRVDARSLARDMADLRHQPDRSWNRRWLVPAIGLVIGASAVLAAIRPIAHSRRTSSPGPLSRTCPPADAGCASSASGDLLNGHFRILGPVGATLLGHWDCGPIATPALLDRATGRLWVFDSWPAAGHSSPGRLVVSVPGAVAAAVVPSPGKPVCDSVEVWRRGRPAQLIAVSRR